MTGETRHAGMHWPANAGGEHPNRETIYSLPGVADGALLLVADSARFWYDEARKRCPLVVWRGLPRPDRLPAKLGWDTKKVADECVNLWVGNDGGQVHHGREWFVPLNELQFPKESGENWRGYGYMVTRLAPLRVQLESYFASLGQDVGLMFPAWVPSDDGDHLDEWRDEAARWDAIAVHCYGSAETQRARYQSYRDAFPGMPLFVGEHNTNHEEHDERAILEMWADIAAADPLFLGATYFIWETRNAGEGDLSVWGNDDRLRLFQNPPVAADPIEPPVEEPPGDPPVEEPPAMPPPTDLPRGLDVASYQGYPDWAAVAAAGYSFAFTKVTEDTGYLNPTFAHNWAGIKAAGMARGAYHFARPGVNDAYLEAAYCLSQIEDHGDLEEGDIIALDLEAGSGDLGQWVLDFLHRCEEIAGIRPIVYTGAWFSEPHNLASYPEIGQYGLWLAAYQSQMPAPPAPWDTVAFWQFTDALSVPGISGNVDGNVFNGTADRIKLYGKPASAPPAPSPYAVGDGIRAAMAEHADEPATDEMYYGEVYSEAFGVSGARYTYIASLGRTYRYEPAA